jgi:hypothetical protein
MSVVGCGPASVLFTTEFRIEGKGKLKFVFAPCTIKQLAKSALGLFEKCVVLVQQC